MTHQTHETHEISLALGGRYVLVRVTAPMSRALAGRVARDARAIGRAHGVSAYLYDLRESRNVDTVVGNYLWAEKDIEELGPDIPTRVACLISVGDRTHDFVLEILKSRGHNVRPFTDESAAIAWVEGGDPE